MGVKRKQQEPSNGDLPNKPLEEEVTPKLEEEAGVEEYEEVEVEEEIEEVEEEEDAEEVEDGNAAAGSDNDLPESDPQAGGGAVDPSDKESIRRLVEPFSKEQLIELLKDAALRDPALAARISATADSDPVHRKIFIHGLAWETTTDTLSAVFSGFGDIEDCRAVFDRVTNRCKGYGFVLFRTRAAARRALKEPQKRIAGRITHCQLASFGAPTGPVPEPSGRKIYITNIPENVNHDRLRAFFSQYGELENAPVGLDPATGKPRGFTIFTYKTLEGCKKALEEPGKVFEGHQLSCQRALEGLKSKAFVPATFDKAAPTSTLQLNDLALAAAYSGLAAQSGQLLNQFPAGGLMGQNVGAGGGGLLNPMAAAAGVTGVVPSVGRSGATLDSAYLGGLGGVGAAASVLGSNPALDSYAGIPSAHISSAAAARSQSGIGSYGAGLQSYGAGLQSYGSGVSYYPRH